MSYADQYLTTVTNLPPVPTAVNELLALLREPNRDVDDIVKVITYEPSLTAEILRCCNSAFFAGQEPATDVFDALTRLGFYESCCIVVSMFGASARTLPGVNEGIDTKAAWHHSVMTAVAAGEVAGVVEEESRSFAFTAGLLHDSGKLILAAAERARYAAVREASGGTGLQGVLAEREAFKVDHAEVGGVLLARWKLPREVVAAVWFHHEPHLNREFPYNRLVRTVQLGDALAHEFETKDASWQDFEPATLAAAAQLNLQPEELKQVMKSIERALERVAGLLNI